MRLFGKLLISVLVLSLSFALCTNVFAEDALSIVCTSFPCYDFARAVTGNGAELHLLIKAGAEVHSYEPTPADVMTIAQCDLFVYIGGESDAWAVDMLSSFGGEAPETLRFFDCVETLEEAGGHEHAHDEGADESIEYDEHIWTSPVNAIAMVKFLAQRLSEIDPERSQTYLANSDAYCAEIADLDAQFAETVRNAARTELIFADRFPFLYFAKEYGLEWHAAFDSCSSESEPSAKTMMELIERIVRDQIPVVYTIEMSNQKTAKAISDETGAQICTFHSVQNVSESEFSAGASYVSLMTENLAALKKGLN